MSELNFLKGRIIEKLRDSGIVSAEAEADRIVNAATDETKAMQLVVQRISGAPLSILLVCKSFLVWIFLLGLEPSYLDRKRSFSLLLPLISCRRKNAGS
jgi:hypothetical protein